MTLIRLTDAECAAVRRFVNARGLDPARMLAKCSRQTLEAMYWPGARVREDVARRVLAVAACS